MKHYILLVAVCIVALSVMQIESFLRRTTLSSVACLPVPYFSTLFHKRHDFRKKKCLDIKRVFWFPLQLLFENICHSKSKNIVQVRKSSCVLPGILANELFNYFDRFSRSLEYQISWKSVHWEPSSVWTDGQTHDGNTKSLKAGYILHASRVYLVMSCLPVR